MFRSLHIAIMFMTTLPTPRIKDWQDDDARRSLKAYPFVGLIVGVVLVLVYMLTGVFLTNVFSDFTQSIMLVAAWLGVTGALHFDGFCDMADAAFASKSPEERQQIAKDVSVGSFAFAAGSILILLKIAALLPLNAFVALLLTPVIARTLILIPMRLFKVSSSSQLARSVSGSWSDVFLPLGLGLTLVVVIAVYFHVLTPVLIIAGCSLIFVLLLSYCLSRRMDGLSGDAYGAIIESNEVFILLLVGFL